MHPLSRPYRTSQSHDFPPFLFGACPAPQQRHLYVRSPWRPGADITQRGRAGSAASGEAANSALLLLRRPQALCERRRGKLGVGQMTLTAVTTAAASQRHESRVRATATRGAAPAGLRRGPSWARVHTGADPSGSDQRGNSAATAAAASGRADGGAGPRETAQDGARCRRAAARWRQRPGRLAPRVPRSSARPGSARSCGSAPSGFAPATFSDESRSRQNDDNLLKQLK